MTCAQSIAHISVSLAGCHPMPLEETSAHASRSSKRYIDDAETDPSGRPSDDGLPISPTIEDMHVGHMCIRPPIVSLTNQSKRRGGAGRVSPGALPETYFECPYLEGLYVEAG